MVVNARGRRDLTEKTTAQVIMAPLYFPELQKDGRRPTYRKIREMRKDPTIAFARWIAVAPVLTSEWVVYEKEGAPEGAKQLIEEEMLRIKNPLLRSAFYGCLDYGWQAYEKVFKIVDGEARIKKLKQLIPDYTWILVDEKTGSYNGIRQYPYTGDEVNLDVNKTLLLNFDVEGTDWYGFGSMDVVEWAYDAYNIVEGGAQLYDQKVAGAHWIVHYPEGKSVVNNVETPNDQIAQDVLRTLQASGGIAVPRQIEGFIDDLNAQAPNAWDIELKSDTGTIASSFNDRLRYYDTLKVRSFGLPERSVLEGQFGTKAEAESHADAAVLNMEMRHTTIVFSLNLHLVNHLLRLNYGPEAEDMVFVQNSPIVDQYRQALTRIYIKLLENPKGYLRELKSINMVDLKREIGLPIDEEGIRSLEEIDIEKEEEREDKKNENGPPPFGQQPPPPGQQPPNQNQGENQNVLPTK